MGVFKEILADDLTALVGFCTSIRSSIYDSDKLFNDLKTRQRILKSTLFCTGNNCDNFRSSLESCLRPFLYTRLTALFFFVCLFVCLFFFFCFFFGGVAVFPRDKMVHLRKDNCNNEVYWS